MHALKIVKIHVHPYPKGGEELNERSKTNFPFDELLTDNNKSFKYSPVHKRGFIQNFIRFLQVLIRRCSSAATRRIGQTDNKHITHEKEPHIHPFLC